MARADALAPSAHVMAAGSDPAGAIPRDYNFAVDLLGKAQRLDKAAYIDPRGTWTYGQLADRVERFGLALHQRDVRREERVLICLLDTIDWPTAFLGTSASRHGRGAGEHAAHRGRIRASCWPTAGPSALVVSDALYPKFAKAHRLRRVPAPRSTSSSPARCRAGVHAHHSLEKLIGGASHRGPYRPPPTTRDDIAFWLYTSGSTGKPKAAVHVHADPRLTNDLYAGPILGLDRERRGLLGRQAVLCLWSRQCADLPAVGRRDHRAAAGPADAGRGGGAAAEASASPRSSACRPSMPPSSRAPAAPQRSEVEAAPLRVGRRGAAARSRPALERALRRRHPRRPRLDRDAAHLPLQPAGRREIRHQRQAGAGLRHQARRRRRRTGQARRDGRASGEGADQRGHVLEQPRAVALDLPGRLDALRRQIYRGRRRLLRLLRPPRRHAEGLRHLRLAVRGRGRAADPSRRAGGGGRRLARRRGPGQAEGLRGAQVAPTRPATQWRGSCRITSSQQLAPYKYPRWIEFRRDLPKTATGKIQRFKLRAERSFASVAFQTESRLPVS